MQKRMELMNYFGVDLLEEARAIIELDQRRLQILANLFEESVACFNEEQDEEGE
jgi:hypothetical protein